MFRRLRDDGSLAGQRHTSLADQGAPSLAGLRSSSLAGLRATSLAGLRPGSTAVLDTPALEPLRRRRLAELGLRAGAEVVVLRRTSGGGRIVAVEDSRIALDAA